MAVHEAGPRGLCLTRGLHLRRMRSRSSAERLGPKRLRSLTSLWNLLSSISRMGNLEGPRGKLQHHHTGARAQQRPLQRSLAATGVQ